MCGVTVIQDASNYKLETRPAVSNIRMQFAESSERKNQLYLWTTDVQPMTSQREGKVEWAEVRGSSTNEPWGRVSHMVKGRPSP